MNQAIAFPLLAKSGLGELMEAKANALGGTAGAESAKARFVSAGFLDRSAQRFDAGDRPCLELASNIVKLLAVQDLRFEI